MELRPPPLASTLIALHLCIRQGSPRKRKGPISGTRGKERFRSEEAFYENPLPDCLCRSESDDTTGHHHLAARKSAPTTGGVKKPHRYRPGTVALRYAMPDTSGGGI
ncbi:hypothetical protein BHM03_00032309 [Ensete ventricosum]|nr:hypothetical protein BHM03_00032309 [Ensete ventricosum]